MILLSFLTFWPANGPGIGGADFQVKNSFACIIDGLSGLREENFGKNHHDNPSPRDLG